MFVGSENSVLLTLSCTLSETTICASVFGFISQNMKKKSLHIEVSFCISDLEGFSFFYPKMYSMALLFAGTLQS